MAAVSEKDGSPNHAEVPMWRGGHLLRLHLIAAHAVHVTLVQIDFSAVL